MSKVNIPIGQLFNQQVSRRAIRVALVVGTILNIINHYDLFLGQHFTLQILIQILLTYAVPYLVSTHGQIIALNNRTK